MAKHDQEDAVRTELLSVFASLCPDDQKALLYVAQKLAAPIALVRKQLDAVDPWSVKPLRRDLRPS